MRLVRQLSSFELLDIVGEPVLVSCLKHLSHEKVLCMGYYEVADYDSSSTPALSL